MRVMKQLNPLKSKGCRLFTVPAVVATLIGLVAGAQEMTSAGVSTNVVTLDAPVAEALEKSPEVVFYEAEIAAAKGGRKTAGLWQNPEATGLVGQKRVRDSGMSEEGLAWSVAVLQPFEWPGRIGLRKAIANQDIE